MEASVESYRPSEGGPLAHPEAMTGAGAAQHGPDGNHPHHYQQPPPHADGGVQFSNSFESEQTRVPGEAPGALGDHVGPAPPRKSSKDYSHTDEWDASKTVPSRFQQRKGSIFATPSSRDGHVQRNLDNDAEFHKQHSKRFSFSKVKDKARDLVDGDDHHGEGRQRRKSSAGVGSSHGSP